MTGATEAILFTEATVATEATKFAEVTEASEATEVTEVTEATKAYLLSNVVLKKNLLHLAGDHVGVQLTGQCRHLVETRRNYQQSD